MKYLINANMKATFKGEFVVANEKKEEFVFDSEFGESTKAVMLGIIEANKLSVKHSLKASEMRDAVHMELKTLKLHEINKMTDTQKVEEIVTAGFAAEKSEDEMLIQIVQAGISFRAAAKMFKTVATEKGLMISSAARREAALEIIKKAKFNPETYDDVLAMVKNIQTNVANTDTKQATVVLRKICKENNVELPAKPKAVKKTGGFRAKIFRWMGANLEEGTVKDLEAWLKAEEKEEVVAKRYGPIFTYMKEGAAPEEAKKEEAKEEASD